MRAPRAPPVLSGHWWHAKQACAFKVGGLEELKKVSHLLVVDYQSFFDHSGQLWSQLPAHRVQTRQLLALRRKYLNEPN